MLVTLVILILVTAALALLLVENRHAQHATDELERRLQELRARREQRR